VAGVSPRHTLCRHAPEWWPDMARNTGPACPGISGRHRPESAVGQENAQIKPGANHVLRWLCHNSVTLKKFAMTVKRLPDGTPGVGPIDFEARVPIPGELFIPTELAR